MKSISITAKNREATGKKASKDLRNEGMVPCIIYGGETPINIQIDEKKFKTFVYTPNTYVVELKVGEEVKKTILKDISFHPVSDAIVHADFLEISEDAPFEVFLPVKFVGTSKGVMAGGVLKVKRRKLKLKGLLKDMPEFIELNIAPLTIGAAIRVRDVKINGLTLLDPSDDLVVSVKTSRKVSATIEDDEEESAEASEAPNEEAAAEA